MKTTQHTPGPWTMAGLSIYADPESRAFGGPIREYLRPVCCMEVCEGGNDPDYQRAGVYPGLHRNIRLPGDSEAEANARLIAAAPELLEALRACEISLDVALEYDGDVFRKHYNDATNASAMARAAISKAEGRA